MIERGDLITLGLQPQVGAGGDQDTHGVDVAARSVAQDDRLVQRGPAQVVDVVDLDLGLDQPTGDVGVAAVGCPISPVPLKESLESTSAPCSRVRFSSSRYPSLVETR